MNYWDKVAIAAPSECWLWTGGTCKSGYGAFAVDGRQFVATHIALVLFGRPRPAPPYNFALHGDCSNPRCVNPAHLRWGTPKENSDDKFRLKRANAARGERSGVSKLTEAQVRHIRTSPATGRKLAEELGVSPALISLVRSRQIWAHVD